MARVAVIGEPLRIHGYGLPDAILCPATDQAEAVLAWRALPDDIDLAVLTPSAARWLASEIARRPEVLPVLLAEASPAEPGVLAEPGLLGEPCIPPTDPDLLAQPRLPPDLGELP
jgi:hypothetical protein